MYFISCFNEPLDSYRLKCLQCELWLGRGVSLYTEGSKVLIRDMVLHGELLHFFSLDRWGLSIWIRYSEMIRPHKRSLRVFEKTAGGQSFLSLNVRRSPHSYEYIDLCKTCDMASLNSFLLPIHREPKFYQKVKINSKGVITFGKFHKILLAKKYSVGQHRIWVTNLNPFLNLHWKTLHPHAKFLIMWIEMTLLSRKLLNKMFINKDFLVTL